MDDLLVIVVLLVASAVIAICGLGWSLVSYRRSIAEFSQAAALLRAAGVAPEAVRTLLAVLEKTDAILNGSTTTTAGPDPAAAEPKTDPRD